MLRTTHEVLSKSEQKWLLFIQAAQTMSYFHILNFRMSPYTFQKVSPVCCTSGTYTQYIEKLLLLFFWTILDAKRKSRKL